jgi:hypothetical protein
MMTKEQILQLVKEHFQEGGVRDDGSFSEYYGDPDAFVKFYCEAYSRGWREGNEEGYEEGYDEATGGN